MSKDRLLSALTASKPIKKSEKPKIGFLKARIERSEKNLMNQCINFLNQKEMS